MSRDIARSWLAARWRDQPKTANTGEIWSTEEKGAGGKQGGMGSLCPAGASLAHLPVGMPFWLTADLASALIV
jgi:hypothetical protein